MFLLLASCAMSGRSGDYTYLYKAMLSGADYNGYYDLAQYKSSMGNLYMRADRGDTDAIFKLGLIHLNGADRPQNTEKAIAWFEKSAMVNDDASQYFLVNLYLDGKRRVPDYEEGYKWAKLMIRRGKDNKTVRRLLDKAIDNMDEIEEARAEYNYKKWLPIQAQAASNHVEPYRTVGDM